MDQSNLTNMQKIVAFLSDSKKLARFRGACRKLDVYFGLIGADSLASIFAGRLEDIFLHDTDVFPQLRCILDEQNGTLVEELAEHQLAALAALLAEVIEKNNLGREVGHVLQKASLIGMAQTRRAGESSFLARQEDEIHDEILSLEFAGIERELFSRLKNGVHSLDPVTSASPPAGRPFPSLLRRGNMPFKSQTPPPQDALVGADSESMSWEEMQAFLNANASLLGDDREAAPITLPWIMANGTKEQWFAYVYEHAEEFDDKLRNTLLEALPATNAGEIPRVWRTVLFRALSRTRAARKESR